MVRHLALLALACKFLPCTGVAAVPLGEALDAPEFEWFTHGEAWIGQTTNSHDGYDAAMCTVTGDSSTGYLTTRLVGPATLNFWQASEVAGSGCAILNLFLDLQPLSTWRCFLESAWTPHVYDIPAGEHLILWEWDNRIPGTNNRASLLLDEVAVSPPRVLQIVQQPTNVVAYTRDSALFSVTVVGTPPFVYQWFKDETLIQHATNATLFFTAAVTNDSGNYHVLVTNSQGTARSSNVLFTVLPPSPPKIISLLGDSTGYSGGSLFLTIETEGSPPFRFAWRKDGDLLSETEWLWIQNLKLSDAGLYTVEVVNQEGIESTNTQVSIIQSVPPTVTMQPRSVVAASGSHPRMYSTADGPPNPWEQWFRNGKNAGSLPFEPEVTADDSAVFWAEFTNPAGSTCSQQAALLVVAPPHSRGLWHGTSANVEARGNIAVIARGTNGIDVLDVSDPDVPVRLCDYQTAGAAHAVRLVGDLAYVAAGSNGLQVLNIADPRAPAKLGEYDTPGYCRDVWISDGRAYVADSDAGLHILDITDPANPIRIGGYAGIVATIVRAQQNRAYIASGLYEPPPCSIERPSLLTLDVHNPVEPEILSYSCGNYEGLSVDGNRWAIATSSCVAFYDETRDPYDSWDGGYFSPARDVHLAGNLAHCAFGTNGIEILVSDGQERIINVARFATAGSANKLCVDGIRVYVAMGENGMQIVDFPERLGTYPPLRFGISADKELHLQLEGPPGLSIAIEHAQTLGENAWETIKTIELTHESESFPISSPSFLCGFYRARILVP